MVWKGGAVCGDVAGVAWKLVPCQAPGFRERERCHEKHHHSLRHSRPGYTPILKRFLSTVQHTIICATPSHAASCTLIVAPRRRLLARTNCRQQPPLAQPQKTTHCLLAYRCPPNNLATHHTCHTAALHPPLTMSVELSPSELGFQRMSI